MTRIESEKMNRKDILPRIARLDREMASLKIVIKKRITEINEGAMESETDIYLQNEFPCSMINQNLKEFVKLVTLIAKTIASEERLHTLQNFVREKVEAFERMKPHNVEQDLREIEIKQKTVLLDKLQEILKYKLKTSTLNAKRNRLSSWQTEWDPGYIKSNASVREQSESSRLRKQKNYIKFNSEKPIANNSAVDSLSPKNDTAEGGFSNLYGGSISKSNSK